MIEFLKDPKGKVSGMRVGAFLGWLYAGGIAFIDILGQTPGVNYFEYVALFLGAAVSGKLIQRGIERGEVGEVKTEPEV